MKHRTINIRWMLVLLAMILATPSWAKVGEQSKDLKESKDNSLGHYTVWAKGEDVGIFFDTSEDHLDTFRKSRFYTIDFFDNANGKWGYKFYIQQWNSKTSGSSEESRVLSDINVYVKTKNGKDYLIGTIAHSESGEVSGLDHTELAIIEQGSKDGEYLLYPKQMLLQDAGIQDIHLSFRYKIARHELFHAKDKEYEMKVTKTIDQGLKFTYTPMPTNAKFSVNENGYLQMVVENVPGHSSECYYRWYSRPSGKSMWGSLYTMDLTKSGTGWNKNVGTNKSVTVVDTHQQFSPSDAYTIKYRGYMVGDKFEFNNPTTDYAESYHVIPAYYYPYDLETSDYDQWENSVTISWKAQTKYKDVTTMDTSFQNRSDKGTWFLYREGDDGTVLLDTLSKDTPYEKLCYKDTKIKPDAKYTYRVAFIPYVMKSNASNVLTWFPDTLKPTIPVTTQRNVNITLNQISDSTLNGIKLYWTYHIEASNSQFVVQRKPAGTGNWEDHATLNVVTSLESATYNDTLVANACTYYDYRIVAKTLGTEFYSNIATECNMTRGTSITAIDVTKGTETNAVIVDWTVDQRGTDDTYFSIERRPILNGNYGDWAKAGEVHGTDAQYTFTDSRAEPGSYYEYRVVAFGQKCEGQIARSSELTDIGFVMSTGTISGHISYGSGNSVQGVRVNLIKGGTDSEMQRKSYSRFIQGNQDGGLVWVADSAHYADRLNNEKPLTVQLWAAPINERQYMPIFTLGKNVEIGLTYQDDNRYRVTFFRPGAMKLLDLYVPAARYSHYTVSYDGAGKWRFIVDGNIANAVTENFKGTWTLADGKTDFHVGGASVLYDSSISYCGLVDDIRLWSRELADKEIPTSYDRLLGGNENGLVLYWPLDEGIDDFTFDVSRQNGVSNQNHPTLFKNTKPSKIVPLNLGIYGVTDEDGNYLVTGIPYGAGGTNYKLLPDYGIHEFQPASRSLYISSSSLTANNVDFTDKSSFRMHGYIYYKDTNIPVKGIYLYVDGDLVNTDGKIAETDEDGYYEISVPIGNHFIEAKQTGHDFVDGGRWPSQGYYDFQSETSHNFSDSTLVNFCGRIAGGQIQENKPVGFGAESGAKNNIGQAVITMALKSNPNLSFNCEEGTTKDYPTERTFLPKVTDNTDPINSTTWAKGGQIFIKTDPNTGEFSAMLPPLRYSVTNIEIPSNADLTFKDLPDINMTNAVSINIDTLLIKTLNADSTINIAVKTYTYNQKMVNNWYADPTLVVKDNSDTLKIGAFGRQTWNDYEDAYGTVDKIQVYHKNTDGDVAYDYDYPVFKMSENYSFSLEAYERYVNKDSGHDVEDLVRLSNEVLNIHNELSDNQAIVTEDAPDEYLKQGDVYNLKSGEIQLDSIGKATYEWRAGMPNPTAPYTRHLSITYERRKRVYTFDVFDAYVFGSLPIGNNFVTTGPDNVLMVLRDPPGSSSSTSWTKGEVSTRIEKMKSRGTEFGAGINFEFISGTDVETATGLGVAIISSEKAVADINAGLEAQFEYNNSWSTTYTLTNTETISTSSDPEFVGANGDVYIGVATNLIIGDCKKVGFFRDGPNEPFEVKDSLTLCVGDSVKTTFMYTQAEIETRQIPEWEKLRTSMLIQVPSEEYAKSYPNDSKYPKYVTWKDPTSDEWTPDKNSYLMVMGTDTSLKEDSIQTLTSQINNWKMRIRDNEQDKLDSRNNTDLMKDMKNISFDSGTAYSYTAGTDTAHVQTKEWHWTIGVKGDGKFGIGVKAALLAGINIDIALNAAYTGSKTTGDYDDNYTNSSEFTYNFSESSIGTAHTVNCYKSGKGWSDHFSTLAGQTYCPYEPETLTKYYEPGTVLSNATIPMQKPQVMVSNGNQNPSSKAVLSDVPSGTSALFTIYLSNEVETDMAMTYVLGVKENTNPDGLQFTVDGVKLGNGRNFVVEPGETVVKTLEVTQTDQSILDYSDVMLTLFSDCQDDISSINGVIMDKCTIDVHFKPSSSPVKLDTDALVANIDNNGQVKFTLTDFNRAFNNLKSMGVEYKAEGDLLWSRLQHYVFNAADSTDQDDIVVPATGDVKLTVDMSDNNSFPDRNYVFRAYTETEYGVDGIRTYSNELTVTKDMHRPTAFGTPQPADGILHAGDDIVVEFNEDIIPGFVNASNVTVTGKVNDQPTTHEVSMHLSGAEPTAATASDFYMQGNSTLATWLKYTQPGTILTHCTGENAFTLAIDDKQHLTVKAGQLDKTDTLELPKDEWMYLTYSYNEETTELSLVIQYGNQSYSKKAHIGSARTLKQVVYSDDKRLFLGGNGLEADLHDLRIYGICRDPLEVATEKYNSTNIYTAGLMAHWPMDEGQGTKARDLRNDAHPLVLTAPNWRIDGTNYAATVDAAKEQHLDLSIAGASTDKNESYVVEFWFKADGDMAGKTLMQAGIDAGNNLRLFTLADGQLVFEYGINRKLVAPDDFDLTGGWHHFALNVTRGASASVTIDGKRTAVMTESALPPLEGAKLVMGAGYKVALDGAYTYQDYMTGAFDEVRVWKGVLKPEVVQSNMYQCLDTLDAAAKGLAVYYPMEAKTTQYGVEMKQPSDKDFAPGQVMPGAMTGVFDLNAFSLNAPPVRKAPEVKTIVSDATVSDRKVFVKLNPGSLAEIEGTTLDVTVSKIFDKNGNTSEPITWQVYVHQNTLGWAKDSVTCIKNYGDDASFQVDIVNTGKSTEYYTVSNLPTWLTTDYTYGEVSPETVQALRFDVLPTAPVGTYDVNLTLTGNNEIAEPLRLVLKVKGVAPDWTVPTDSLLEDQMNIVSQVIIDGIVNENVESRLGAFIGTMCVGVATSEKTRGSYYVPMTVYGNAARHNGQALTFKFWDASTGITYVGLKAEPSVVFQQDGMKGSYNYPVILTNSNEVEQRFDVATGWNWISTNVQPADGLSLSEVLVADGFLKNDIIKDKSAISFYDGGTWNKGTLTAIQPASMYKLYVQQPVSIVVKGKECAPSQTPITLNPEWNWIGFVPQSAMDINQALGGSGAIEGDYIKSKSAFAMYGPYGWEGNLKTLEPSKGYMFYSQANNTRTFLYPEVSATSRTVAFRSPSALHTSHFTPVAPEHYPDNMSLVVKLVCNEQPVDTFELAAFIDGECRAATKADDGLYYLMVQGEGSGQPIQLRTCYEGVVLVIDDTQVFRGDTNIGLPWDPYVIDLGQAILTGIKDVDNSHAEDGEVKYFLPNGIQVKESSIGKGQIFIRYEKSGKVTKQRK